jgi:hypothetical protein
MRFPLRKRRTPTFPTSLLPSRRVLKIEDAAVKALVNAFQELALVIDEEDIQEAIENGDLAALLDVFDLVQWELHERRLRDEMTPRVAQVIATEGKRAFDDIVLRNQATATATGGRGTSPPALPPTTFGDPSPAPGPSAKFYTSLRFDMTDPYAISYAERFAGDLVREVTRSTRAAIREAIVDSFRNGYTAMALAKRLRLTIGLTAREASWVENYRLRLERAGVLDDARIDVLTRRYYRKLRNKRAERIARTEILRSSNMGRQQGWLSAADHGLLDMNASVKEWVSTADGPSIVDPGKPETCPVCSAMDKQKVQGLDGEFTLPSGRKIPMPPAHPNCRCTAVVHPPDPPEDYDENYPHARA